jgi:hypothetical protein
MGENYDEEQKKKSFKGYLLKTKGKKSQAEDK